LTREVLPALKLFHFVGVSEYLEDVVSQIDTPLLDTFHAVFFNQVVFDVPHLSQLISRVETLKTYCRVSVFFGSNGVFITLQPTPIGLGTLKLGILCEPSDWQFSALEQVFVQQTSPLALLVSGVEWLDISENRSDRQVDVDGTQWLELLRPFVTVENLCLSERLGPLIVPVLTEEVATGILPELRNLFLEGLGPSRSSQFVQEVVEPFIAARQVLGNPVGFHEW
jgi:hypothetical protein